MNQTSWLTLGAYLKHQRSKVGLTQIEVAEKLKLNSGQYVSNWERDAIPISRNLLIRLIPILELDVEIITDFLIEKTRIEILRQLKDVKENRRSKRQKKDSQASQLFSKSRI
jgi:transcriptional regulator with XRE-family HTH domain